MHSPPTIGISQNLPNRCDYRAFFRQNSPNNEYISGTKLLLCNVIGPGTGLIIRVTSSGVGKFLLLHNSELLLIDNTGRGQPKCAKCEWLDHQLDLFPIYGCYAWLTKFTMLEKADCVYQTDSSKKER